VLQWSARGFIPGDCPCDEEFRPFLMISFSAHPGKQIGLQV